MPRKRVINPDALIQPSEGRVVVIGEWTYTGKAGKVRQPSVSVVDVRDGKIWRDLEYVGLEI